MALELLAPDVPRTPSALAETYVPDPEHSAYYREALARQEQIYAALLG
jgi:gluconokinase